MRIIRRKVNILKQYAGNFVYTWSGGGDTGRFAKGKIHCSCRMCRTKSYDNLSHADRKKFLSVQQQVNETDYSQVVS
jgi:hypothetical protein